MPNINCPLCGAALNLPDSAAGKEVACGICKGRFNAPAVAADQPTAAPLGAAPPPAAGGFAIVPMQAPYGSYPPPIPVQLPTSGFAIASLVLGICSIPTCICYGVPAIVCGILGIVFGGKAQQAVEAGLAAPGSLGLAKAGKICGIVGIIVAILFWVFYGVFIWSVLSGSGPFRHLR